MSKARWSSTDFKNNGLVEVNGVFVKADKLVAKGKVDKIKPPFMSMQYKHPDVDKYNGKGISTVMELDEVTQWAPVKQNRPWTFLLPTGAYIDILCEFDINPVPAPRMTQSDKWKTNPDHDDPLKRQRKPVERYFAFRSKLQGLCLENGYNLTGVLNILFVVPMPKSWSKKKRLAMNNQPHRSRPDRDNYLKSFQDSFSGDDGHVWDGRTIKIWGETGKIIIF